jgi:hypothetical protein
MRDGVKHGYDLGELQIVSWVSRFKRVMRRQLRRQFFRRYSLFYGYFRSSGAPDPFCGTAVEQLFLAAGAWSPPGVTLLVNEGNGRLTLAATYCPDTVSEQRISGFLDALVSDLLM